MNIRKEQIEAFEQVALRNFENEMVAHLEKFFPKNCEIHGEPKIREIIRYGIEEAEVHGLTSEHDVCMYISLMLMLGHSFYKDPQLPWASAIFKDENISPSIKIDRIYDKAMAYLDQVAGVNDENIKRALHQIRGKSASALFQLSTGDFEHDTIDQLNEIFPEKCQAVGDANMYLLIQEGIKSAQYYNISNNHDVFIYIGCMFILGSGFDSDPQFTWATAILQEKSATKQDAKANKLYNAVMTSLKQWLA
ncbi:MAG: hypothetical protein DRR16_09485 [Candidatus Parabeggiatoa sp. nov. 3]|jgi:hypothetical protein|nr:MAG: hypothetical protein DRR00_15615 [Gammaproteobacteria bacterium]RKZ65695.1 MAG: hypothetical protein DRQ99_11885 [Gammaproteobacteria bacterium]RKZ86546.1 MAG: hypothetical protein DRR16_09485 [Gammaproteobacteria bacterium]